MPTRPLHSPPPPSFWKKNLIIHYLKRVVSNKCYSPKCCRARWLVASNQLTKEMCHFKFIIWYSFIYIYIYISCWNHSKFIIWFSFIYIYCWVYICKNSRKGCIHNDIFTFESIISRLFKADKDGMILPFYFISANVSQVE